MLHRPRSGSFASPARRPGAVESGPGLRTSHRLRRRCFGPGAVRRPCATKITSNSHQNHIHTHKALPGYPALFQHFIAILTIFRQFHTFGPTLDPLRRKEQRPVCLGTPESQKPSHFLRVLRVAAQPGSWTDNKPFGFNPLALSGKALLAAHGKWPLQVRPSGVRSPGGCGLGLTIFYCNE
jgi:hypothetical protein